MEKKKAVLFLEPLNHVLKVVEAAHSEGFTPICIHNLPLTTRPPYGSATALLDMAIEISSWTKVAELEAAYEILSSKYEIVGTYSAAEITLVWESQIRQRLGLPTNGPELISETLNKYHVRRLLQTHGLTELTCYSQDEVQSFTQWPEGLVAYFKPVNGSASAHVHRCTSMTDLDHAMTAWQKQSEATLAPLKEYIHSNNGYFLEQGAHGELVSLEGLSFDGEYTVLGLTSRTVLESNPVVEMGACFPYQHPHFEKIVEKVKAIHRVLGFKHGATHTEVMVSEDGIVELVELNVRFVGADILMVMNAALKTELQHQLLLLGLGQAPQKLLANGAGFAAVQYFLTPENVETFQGIEFPTGNVVFQRVIAQVGQALSKKANQEGFLAAFITVADRYSELLGNVSQIRRDTKVNGMALGHQPNNRVILK